MPTKESLLKKTAEDLRSGIVRDDYDMRQTLTFCLSTIIHILDHDTKEVKKPPKTLYT